MNREYEQFSREKMEKEKEDIFEEEEEINEPGV